MNIDFFCTNCNLNTGSYRIWINDSIEYLSKISNINVKLCKNFNEIREDSIIIFSKGDYRNALDKRFSNRIKGAINVSASDLNLPLDFIIVGSLEEKLSLYNAYKNVFIINLIEKIYENNILKEHKESNEINISYHGSYTHLHKLNSGFFEALKRFKKENIKLKFSCLVDNLEKSKYILDNFLDAEDYRVFKYSVNESLNFIKKADIGVVPNVTKIKLNNINTSVDLGLYDTDYILRFKNKSNPGRCFPFIQLGIPVITDLTPSNMPMFFDEKCGLISNCKNSWYFNIKKLLKPEYRNIISNNAFKRFKNLYSFESDWNNLIKHLKERINE